MREGPSEPLNWGRFQTSISCCGPKAVVVNVLVKRCSSTASCVDKRPDPQGPGLAKGRHQGQKTDFRHKRQLPRRTLLTRLKGFLHAIALPLFALLRRITSGCAKPSSRPTSIKSASVGQNQSVAGPSKSVVSLPEAESGLRQRKQQRTCRRLSRPSPSTANKQLRTS